MTLASLHPYLLWVSEHPTISGLIVFLISLSESLAVVGLVVPGVILMTAIGSLIGAGRLPAIETMVWAMLGAIAGDGLSYWLGYHYRYKLKYLWPFNKFPTWLDRGTVFFKIHGGKSIILGRFVGPIRPTIPVIAGIMGMTPKSFLFFNIASAVCWAPLYSLPGILIGASLGQLSPKTASTVLSLILGLLFILWLIFYLLLKIIIYIKKYLTSFFIFLWDRWQASNKLSSLRHILISAKEPDHGQLGTAIIFILSLVAFIVILYLVKTESSIIHWNYILYQCFRSLYNAKMASWSIVMISLGEPWVLLLVAVVAGVIGLSKHKKAALCWFGIIFIGYAFGQYCKLFIDSPRPEGLMQAPNTYSFPSNHVLLATLIYGFIAVFVRSTLPRKLCWIAWAISIPIILIVSFCGMYLGLHWFTDMIGGLTLGLACVSMGVFLYRRFVVDDFPLQRLVIIGALGLSFAIPIYNYFTLASNQKNWQRQWPSHTLEISKWWGAHPVSHTLYRSGVFKRHAMPFDFNWLGDLPSIEAFLLENGWQILPQLNIETGIMVLADKPTANQVPVFPRFHRDRLPSLVVMRHLSSESKRLVIQLWASDYRTRDGVPLWVGTIRLENVENKMQFLTFYIEDTDTIKSRKLTKQFIKSLQDRWQYKKIIAPPYSLYLIASQNVIHSPTE